MSHMPGGIGAVAYNAIVAQRLAESNTIVAFSGGSLLNWPRKFWPLQRKTTCAGSLLWR